MHAPHHVPRDWADKYQGQFDDGWDAYREKVFERQLELGVVPPGHAALGARSRRRRVERAARRREAALRADDGGVRRIPRAHRPPHRTAARLPRQDRTARRHAHHAGERQRRQRRGGAARLGQREPVLQQRPRDGRRRPEGDRRPRRAEVLQPLPVGLGLGGERPVPPLEARDLPRRLQRSVHRPLAEGDQGAGGDSQPVRAHHRHAADGAGGARPRGADADPRRDPVTDSRRLVRARAGRRQGRVAAPHPVLRDDGSPVHLSRRLARGLPGPRTVVHRGGDGLRPDGDHRGEAARARREGVGALPRRRGLLGDAEPRRRATATS